MIDFTRAFDTINHNLLWSKLARLGVSFKFISILRSLYTSAEFSINPHHGADGFEQTITEGVLQGDAISPQLFIIFLADMETYMRSRGCHGIPIAGRELMVLFFADDISILADSVPDAQMKMRILEDYCRENHLTINSKKSKIMTFGKGGRPKRRRSIFCKGEELEYVTTFQYLGVLFSSNGKFTANKDMFVSKAKSAIGSTREVLWKGKVSAWGSKFKLFDALTGSVLLYAAEVWGLWHMDDIEVVQQLFLKSILCLQNGTPGHFLRLETGRLPLKASVFERAVKFLMRVLRMDVNRWPLLCLRELSKHHMTGRSSEEFNWVSRLDSVLVSLGVVLNWETLSYEQVKAIHKDLIIMFNNHCHSCDTQRAMNSGYSVLFRSIVDFTGRQSYLGLGGNIHRERIIAQLRLAPNGCSFNDVIRFYHKRSKYSWRSNDLCTVCNQRAPETLSHFLLRCPLYKPYREHYLAAFLHHPLPTSTRWDDTYVTSLLDLGTARNKMQSLYQFTWRSLMLRSFARNEW
uniref:Reverse transcriptase domain-containing protein n=1 Tax=Lygus hesperus TaxID=30085 RepID=A0A0K8SIW0_LYGHE